MLNLNDIQNLQNLLKRATYSGIEEAEVGVILKHKLNSVASNIQDATTKEAEEAIVAKHSQSKEELEDTPVGDVQTND